MFEVEGVLVKKSEKENRIPRALHKVQKEKFDATNVDLYCYV